MVIMPPLRADRINQVSFHLKAFVNLISQQAPLELGCIVKTMPVAVKQQVLMPQTQLQLMQTQRLIMGLQRNRLIHQLFHNRKLQFHNRAQL